MAIPGEKMGDEQAGYEVAVKVVDPLDGAAPEVRTTIEDVCRLLKQRSAEDRSDAQYGLLSLFRGTPGPALDKTIPSASFRTRILPVLRKIADLKLAIRKKKTPSAAALLGLQSRQLEAYVAMALKSPDERKAERLASKFRPGELVHYRFEKTDFDEPKAWISIGSAGYKNKSCPSAAASVSLSSSGASCDQELSAAGAPVALSSSDRNLLSHHRLKELCHPAKNKNKRKKKKKNKGKTLASSSPKSSSGDESEAPEAPLADDSIHDQPRSVYCGASLESMNVDGGFIQAPKKPVAAEKASADRADAFAQPSKSRENCWKNVDDPADLIPVDAVGKTLPNECGESTAYFVAMWYKNGKTVMGRVWAGEDGICGSFATGGKEFAGLLGSTKVPGSVEILCYPPEPLAWKRMGFEYGWKKPDELATAEAGWGPWTLVKVMNSTAVLLAQGMVERLGGYDATSDIASVGWNGKEDSAAGRDALAQSHFLARRERL